MKATVKGLIVGTAAGLLTAVVGLKIIKQESSQSITQVDRCIMEYSKLPVDSDALSQCVNKLNDKEREEFLARLQQDRQQSLQKTQRVIEEVDSFLEKLKHQAALDYRYCKQGSNWLQDRARCKNSLNQFAAKAEEELTQRELEAAQANSPEAVSKRLAALEERIKNNK